jgi:nickel/cobalt transporter (NiCoT) family protein
MLPEIASSFRGAQGDSLRRRILLVYSFLVALNAAAWLLAFAMFHAYPTTLSLCFLAYGLGLRHAVDADHIASIDNVTRKLMQENKRPVCVGFFFSLGHSTVVVLLSLLAAYGAGYVKNHFPEFQKVGGVIGASVSALFLLLIAVVNLTVFLDVFKRFRAVRKGSPCEENAAEDLLAGGGIMARAFRSLFKLIGESWQMYFIGFLFGLGFDTATEIALLGMAATEAAHEAPLWSIMVFPLLFTSGMCLLDTTDGIVMLGAYGWAFVRPVRKLFYNMTITFVSFAVALLIGGLEALNILALRLHLNTGVWAHVKWLGENSTAVGYGIIALMIASWLASVAYYRFSGLDELGSVRCPTES